MFGKFESSGFSAVQRLTFALVLVLVVILVGTIGFIILEQRSLLDALYLTLATISTLGMKSADQADPQLAGRIWIMFLLLLKL